MRQLKFMLDSDSMAVKMRLSAKEFRQFVHPDDDLTDIKKYGVTVAFDAESLGEPNIRKTWWTVSDAPLIQIGKFEVKRFTQIGGASWGHPKGRRYQGHHAAHENLYIEVCDEWLKNLFGVFPQDLWFRRSR